MFKWKDSFSTNIEEIDNQHKKLIDIGSRITDIVMAKDGLDHYDEIIELINELKDYTVYHFNYEENLLEKYGYKDLKRHKLQHFKFIQKISEFIDKDIDDNQKEVTIEMMVFLADWIENHILKVDAQYSEYLNNLGVH